MDGLDTEHYHADFPSTDKGWTQLRPGGTPPCGRCSHTATLVGDLLYIIGGGPDPMCMAQIGVDAVNTSDLLDFNRSVLHDYGVIATSTSYNVSVMSQLHSALSTGDRRFALRWRRAAKRES